MQVRLVLLLTLTDDISSGAGTITIPALLLATTAAFSNIAIALGLPGTFIEPMMVGLVGLDTSIRVKPLDDPTYAMVPEMETVSASPGVRTEPIMVG